MRGGEGGGTSRRTRCTLSGCRRPRQRSGRGLARYPLGSPWLCPPFPASCPCRFAVSPSPTPATSNGADGFPVRRFPGSFASRVMRPIRRRALSGIGPILHSVVSEEPERLMQPRRTPPRPAEAPAISRPHHVPPHLLLDPQFHVGKAATRVPDPEVGHPAAQDGVDLGDHPPDRLGVRALEHRLELLQHRRPLFQLGRVLRPPRAPSRADAPEVKP